MKTYICNAKTYCHDCFIKNRKYLEKQYGNNFLFNVEGMLNFMEDHSLENKECVLIDNQYYCKKHGLKRLHTKELKISNSKSRARRMERNRQAMHKGFGKINGHSARGRLN